MKSKKAVYILLPIVLILWVIIFYRIFTSRNSEPGIVLTNNNLSENYVPQQIETDTFNIVASYRDPFLGKTVTKNPSITKSQIKRKPVKNKPVKSIRWPSITYGGMIKNQKSNKLVAIVKINGQDNLIMEGKEFSGVKIQKVFPDSIRIIYQGEVRTFSKL